MTPTPEQVKQAEQVVGVFRVTVRTIDDWETNRKAVVERVALALAAEAQAAIQCPLHHIPMTACQEEVKRFEQAAAQAAKQEERERCISAMSELHTEECKPIGGILRRCCCRVGEIVAQLRAAPLVGEAREG